MDEITYDIPHILIIIIPFLFPSAKRVVEMNAVVTTSSSSAAAAAAVEQASTKFLPQTLQSTANVIYNSIWYNHKFSHPNSTSSEFGGGDYIT